MNTYLVIITSVLVVTQIIRITQNGIQLHRQNKLYGKQLKELAEYEINKDDIATQKAVYRLALEFLQEMPIPGHDEHCERCTWSVEGECVCKYPCVKNTLKSQFVPKYIEGDKNNE